MAADGTPGPKNEPVFLASGAPAIDVDPGLVAQYAAKVGNRRVGTAAERNAAAGKDVWEGLEWHDTTDGGIYRYLSGGWVLIYLPWTAYTPVWTAAGGTTALGASVLTGAYQVVGTNVHVRIYFKLGTGSSQGSGNWRFTLPVTVSGSATRTPILAAIENNGVGFYVGAGFVDPGGTVVSQIAMNSGTGHVAGGTGGPTWQPNSVIALDGTYQR